MIESDAGLSECLRYRYWLLRRWAPGGWLMVWAMLNPSTADADQNDPTIMQVRQFSRAAGAAGAFVVNMHAYRAAKPYELKKVADPFGPDNDYWLWAATMTAVTAGRPIVCAWGANDTRGADVAFIRQAKRLGADLRCLGTTASGAPRHPLFMPRTLPLVAFGA